MGDIRHTQSDDDDEDICPICLDSLHLHENTIQLPSCLHKYHIKCILLSFEGQIPQEWKCPCCRSYILGSSTDKTKNATWISSHSPPGLHGNSTSRRKPTPIDLLPCTESPRSAAPFPSMPRMTSPPLPLALSQWMRLKALLHLIYMSSQETHHKHSTVSRYQETAPNQDTALVQSHHTDDTHRETPHIDDSSAVHAIYTIDTPSKNRIIDCFMEFLEKYMPSCASIILMYYAHAHIQYLLFVHTTTTTTTTSYSINNNNSNNKNTDQYQLPGSHHKRRCCPTAVHHRQCPAFSRSRFPYHSHHHPLVFPIKFFSVALLSIIAILLCIYALSAIMWFAGNEICHIADALQSRMARLSSDNVNEIDFDVQCQPMVPNGMWLPVGFALLSFYITMQLGWLWGVTVREIVMKFDQVAFKVVGLWFVVCMAYTVFVYTARLLLTVLMVLSGSNASLSGRNGVMVVASAGEFT